jgi:predicted dehydrogenase
MSIRFAAVGLSHNHIYNMVALLLEEGAELQWVFGHESDRVAEFALKYPQARIARTIDEILDDSSIQLVVSASIPNERADLGIRAMLAGKDFLCTKPGFTTLEQVAEARRIQAETQRKYTVYFGERFGNRATVKGSELVLAGAIGRVIQTVGLGPHRLYGYVPRPVWSFERAATGGILNDLASHQIDQFIHFTKSNCPEIVSAQVANFNHSQYPDFEDFGDLSLRSEKATGYIRVDWFTPDGLDTWGDVRLFILGTEGYIELRKNTNLDNQGRSNHLFIVNGKSVEYIDCNAVPLPFGAQFIYDVLNRTETAMTQAHCFLVSELAIQAQLQAERPSFSPQVPKVS